MNRLLLSLVPVLFLASGLKAQEAVLRKKNGNLEKGVAIQGYDPVAYFTQHKAVKGKKELAVQYDGIVYYFSTPENKESFRRTPAGYEPAYGGWCAYAMGAKGEKVTVDPGTFKIIDHQLYLFYNKFFNNTLNDWNKNETNLKKQADANWQRLYH
jgi:YHS domain-containing protein